VIKCLALCLITIIAARFHFLHLYACLTCSFVHASTLHPLLSHHHLCYVDVYCVFFCFWLYFLCFLLFSVCSVVFNAVLFVNLQKKNSKKGANVFCAAAVTLVQGINNANIIRQAFVWTDSCYSTEYITNGVRQGVVVHRPTCLLHI